MTHLSAYDGFTKVQTTIVARRTNSTFQVLQLHARFISIRLRAVEMPTKLLEDVYRERFGRQSKDMNGRESEPKIFYWKSAKPLTFFCRSKFQIGVSWCTV